MANALLNSDNPRLQDAAVAWAHRHGMEASQVQVP
jgi:hypothetical protein